MSSQREFLVRASCDIEQVAKALGVFERVENLNIDFERPVAFA